MLQPTCRTVSFELSCRTPSEGIRVVVLKSCCQAFLAHPLVRYCGRFIAPAQSLAYSSADGCITQQADRDPWTSIAVSYCSQPTFDESVGDGRAAGPKWPRCISCISNEQWFRASPRLNKRLTAKRALTQRRTPTRSFAICVRHDKQTLPRPRRKLRRFDDMDSWSMRATFTGC